MPNPKDTKEEQQARSEVYLEKLNQTTLNERCWAMQAKLCSKCGKCLHFGECHFPGCHKVHIECAGDLVEYAARIFLSALANGSKSEDIIKWVERWK